MKLLLDQNLSHRLIEMAIRTFPGIKHVKDVGLEGADDERIWLFARNHGFTIVSKDSDFMHRSTMRGHPPKVIQLRGGNRSTDEIAKCLVANKSEIRRFQKSTVESLLILQ